MTSRRTWAMTTSPYPWLMLAGIGVSVAFWIGCVAVLQRMGKADPLLRQIYARHVRYRPFYPAKSGLFSRCLVPPRAWR